MAMAMPIRINPPITEIKLPFELYNILNPVPPNAKAIIIKNATRINFLL